MPAEAYEVPLVPAALHDAWTLGQRNDQATAEFLAPYSQQVSEGAPTSPHVAEIEILTPFAQVVDQSRLNLSNYSEPQAAQAYHQRGDTVVVRIRLMLPAAFPKSEAVQNKPVYSAATNASPSTLDGQTVWLEFESKNVASEEIRVEVTTPDANQVSTTFDLKKLR